ncbi:MAG TPA: hypothetical protein VJP83_04670 [Terriglobales bacterium]|nr:hypothetical protein [Terriglobales bacterium]
MLAVGVGVVTDIVAAKRGDDVRASTSFQRACLLSHYLKGCWDAFSSEEFGKALGRIITGRQNVVLSIEPKDHIYGM